MDILEQLWEIAESPDFTDENRNKFWDAWQEITTLRQQVKDMEADAGRFKSLMNMSVGMYLEGEQYQLTGRLRDFVDSVETEVDQAMKQHNEGKE